jgi:exopolysaccharide biosynthesis polyprenyl glycosylphosphotransferase
LIDIALIYLALLLTCFLRQKTLFFKVDSISSLLDPLNPYRFLFVFWAMTIVLLLNSRTLYQTKREIIEGFEIGLLIRSIMISSFIVVLAIYGLRLEDFPRSIFVLGSFFIIVFLSIWRIIKRLIVQYLVSQGYNNFNTIIVGAGKVGIALAEEITKRPQLGIRIVGFLDDFKAEAAFNGHRFPVIGKIADFQAVVKKEFISKMFVTVHHDEKIFARLLEEARDSGVAVRVVPQGYEMISTDFSKYNIGIIPILEYSDQIPLRKQVGKRIFDFAISSVALLLLWPVFLAIIIMIKLDSPGRALYVSKRYGRYGRIFRMYKFRSMRQDADKVLAELKARNEVDGPIFKIKNDPRITKMGRLLRKYSLDELPQLINVFQGEMSLVGPRPFPIGQVEREDLKQLKRLEVRPGITGLWQIKGRSDISFARLVKWDAWYINNWSFWLDLNILFQTIPVVLKARGAY